MSSTARELLDAAYARLGFAEGDLIDAGDRPSRTTSAAWVDKGDWLALAKRVGAEKVFFVNNYPVIVFAEQASGDPSGWMKCFNAVWCMARPQLLFLARDGDLSVFNLGVKPARQDDDRSRNERLLDGVRATADVQDRLAKYRRDQVESGRLFEDTRFGTGDRADRALIRDLGTVRRALIQAGLSATYAHALIGRSIFIRYLEDRRVLTEDYFRRVARGDRERWPVLLDEGEEAASTPSGRRAYYPSVLGNKAFTYALFTRLARDFNGDLFPVDAEEHRAVGDRHLRLLRRFLLAGGDENLFFFAYQFDIIPIELISSIYETFYSTKPGQRRDDGSYYTPAALVDFVLAQTLGPAVLARRPRVMDPACGSGIFLVEAFRRIVRHRVEALRRRLRPNELRAILRDQIAGMDLNPEAVRVAAFSLYLAMLHYLEPPDILQHKLPCLTYAARARTDPQRHFDILVAEDAFRIDESVHSKAVRGRFTTGCADVVVGNPPWGAPKANVPEELRSDGGVAWCEQRGLRVGDKERSQSFIHRSLDLLRDGGRAGLLVSTGVFFKRHDNTRQFREQWLTAATLRGVVNFAAVRKAFFQSEGGGETEVGRGAVAPFAAVVFDKAEPALDSAFGYWSAKETAFVRNVQAVVLNRSDFCHAGQAAFLGDDTLWKIFWWGNHRDLALIQRLRLEESFRQAFDPDETQMRVGFKEANRDLPSEWLAEYQEFPTKGFERYGPAPVDQFVDAPDRVHRRAQQFLYDGPRLLIKRGIDHLPGSGGHIAARYETIPFCFRHSIYCLPVPDLDEDRVKVVLAILWSSLTRYFLFLTSGTWGLWHDDLRKDVLYSLPVRFPTDPALRRRIVSTVDALRNLPAPATGTLFSDGGITPAEREASVRRLEDQLDRDVFDLFELTAEERERVTELCGLGLDLFYRGMASDAVQPLDWPDHAARSGRMADLAPLVAGGNELARYLATYVSLWEPHLQAQAGRLRWRVVRPPASSSMLAAVFQTEESGDPGVAPTTTDEQEWVNLLLRLEDTALQPAKARRVYVDGLVRHVTESDMVIIKRNERRLWTPSVARDDAEAAMLMVMHLSSAPEPPRGPGGE